MHNIEQIINIARKAMLLEAITYPKPGLVDSLDSGSHKDMDIMTFIISSVSMDEEFTAMYQAGCNFKGADLRELFEEIRPIGLIAETKMRQATDGVNTHKGAIFSLGVIISALGYVEAHDKLHSVDDIFATVKLMMVSILDDFQDIETKPADKLTHGERLYLAYNVLGIRKEVHEGFPIVQNYALPFLRKENELTNASLLDTLMLIMFHCEDSNLIKRAGNIEILTYAKHCAKAFFATGGAQTPAGQLYLRKLNETFVDKNLSIGGSADLLIVSIFIYLYEKEILKNKPS